MKIRNVSRFGDLDVPLLGGVIGHDEVVDVTPEQAEKLLAQADVWVPADEDAAAVAVETADPIAVPVDDPVDGVIDPDGDAVDVDTVED